MDSSGVLRSEYLSNRLREKKTTTTMTNTRPSRPGQEDDKLSRSFNGGRDDGIFDLDEAPLKRKAPPSSAAGPSAWRFEDREGAHSRRASGTSANSGGPAPRAMGIREMEEHVDKLSKQNFDLKLEVFHRREQNEELEKKLQDLPRLEEDHAELLEMNEEMVLELERRDHAVDEAVVIICNLEERIRALEEQLADTRPTTAQQETPDRTTSDAHSSRAEMRLAKTQDTPVPMPSKEFRVSGVSPHVSARLAELATPAPEDKRLSRLPSFLNTDEPATNNLRNLFVDGDTVIRPIPSYATLLTRNDGKEEDEFELPNSPRLSTLSESEFKSIYGKEEPVEPVQPVDIPPVPKLPDFVASQPRNDGDIARQSREARTNQWVADAAALPVKMKRTHRPSSPDVGQFQSLGDVLHKDRGNALTGSAQSSKRKPVALKESTRKEYTPPASDLPVFGQSIFPPTPDTMQTRPSNQSSTSIVQDKSFNDSSTLPPRGYSSLIPMMQSTQLDGSRSHTGFASRVAPLAKDFPAAYGQQYSRPEPDFRYANNDFGVSLFRRDEYEEIPDFLTPKNPGRPPIAWRTAMDEESMFGSSPPRGSPSPPRYFGSRRLSLEALAQPHVTRRRPSDQLLRLSSEPRTGGASFSSQDAFTLMQDTNGRPALNNSSNSRAPKTPVKSESAVIESPREVIASNEVSPGAELAPTSPLAGRTGNSSLSNRAASLRRRMNKFTRRTIGSTSTAGSTVAESTPGKAGRSNSITKHFKGLRRGSNSQADLEDANRASVFVDAAQAAAPSLSYETKDLPALPPSSPLHQPKPSSSTGSRFEDRVSRSGHSNVSSDSASMRNKIAVPAPSIGSGTGNLNMNSSPLSPNEQRQLNTMPRSGSKPYPATSYTAMVGAAAAAAVSSTQYSMRGRQMDMTGPSLAPRQSHSGNRNWPNYP